MDIAKAREVIDDQGMCDAVFWSEVREYHEPICDALVAIVKDYGKLTDPSPITEKAMRDRGFVDIPNMPTTRLQLGHIVVRCTDPMLWWHADFRYVEPQPRTLGELEQLIRRVNGATLPICQQETLSNA